jgi:hypothetical protein
VPLTPLVTQLGAPGTIVLPDEEAMSELRGLGLSTSRESRTHDRFERSSS